MKLSSASFSFVVSALIFASTTADAAESNVLFSEDFESGVLSEGIDATAKEGQELAIIDEAEDEAAGGSVEGSQKSLRFIDGGEDAPFPRLRVPFSEVTTGAVKLSFHYKNTSDIETGFYIDVGEIDGDLKSQARLLLRSTDFSTWGTGHNVGGGLITSGADAQWHRIEMTVPAPQSADTGVTVTVDGEVFEGLKAIEYQDPKAISMILMTDDGTEPNTIYIDNIKIEALP